MQTQLQTQIQRTPFSHYILVLRRSSEQEEAGAMAKPLDDQMAQTEPLHVCEPFGNLDDSLFMPGKPTEKKTRSQERLEHARFLEITAVDLPSAIQKIVSTPPPWKQRRI